MRLIILMLIVGKVDIPVAEVEMMKAHPAWDAVFAFLIVWCVFWFLDGFIANFLEGYTQQHSLFYGSMLVCFKNHAKRYGIKKTSLKMKHAVSYENYLRRHPAFRRKVDSLNTLSGNLSYEEYNARFAKLCNEEGIYLKKGWKVCRVRKRNRKSSSTE